MSAWVPTPPPSACVWSRTAQALEFRHRAGAGKSSPVIEKFFEDYRKEVPFIEEDTVMYTRIKDSIDFIRKAEF